MRKGKTGEKALVPTPTDLARERQHRRRPIPCASPPKPHAPACPPKHRTGASRQARPTPFRPSTRDRLVLRVLGEYGVVRFDQLQYLLSDGAGHTQPVGTNGTRDVIRRWREHQLVQVRDLPSVLPRAPWADQRPGRRVALHRWIALSADSEAGFALPADTAPISLDAWTEAEFEHAYYLAQARRFCGRASPGWQWQSCPVRHAASSERMPDGLLWPESAADNQLPLAVAVLRAEVGLLDAEAELRDLFARGARYARLIVYVPALFGEDGLPAGLPWELALAVRAEALTGLCLPHTSPRLLAALAALAPTVAMSITLRPLYALLTGHPRTRRRGRGRSGHEPARKRRPRSRST